jgi:hypothetical protein
MVQLYPPASHAPVVPVIGPNVLNLTMLQRDPTDVAFSQGWDSRLEALRTEEGFRASEMIEHLGRPSYSWPWTLAWRGRGFA